MNEGKKKACFRCTSVHDIGGMVIILNCSERNMHAFHKSWITDLLFTVVLWRHRFMGMLSRQRYGKEINKRSLKLDVLHAHMQRDRWVKT
jgi:hypothetical protein